jgi:prophage regulatory protein
MQDHPTFDLPAEGFARLPAVLRATGLSRSHLYALVKSGQFVAPVVLGARAVGWDVVQVRAWIAARIEASRKPATKQAGAL